MPLPSSWQAFRGGTAARPFIVYGSGAPAVSRTAVVSVPLRFAVARLLPAIALGGPFKVWKRRRLGAGVYAFARHDQSRVTFPWGEWWGSGRWQESGLV